MNGILAGTPSQSNGNERVLHIPQVSRTGAWNQMQFSDIPKTPIFGKNGVLTPLQGVLPAYSKLHRRDSYWIGFAVKMHHFDTSQQLNWWWF